MPFSIVNSSVEGVPTAIVRPLNGPPFYLHSPDDPIAEAHALIKDVARQERALYVVLGFGLGYHVKALLDAIPSSAHVIVIEPEWARFSQVTRQDAHHAAWMSDKRLHFHATRDADIVPIHLVEYLAALKLMSVNLVHHAPSMQTAGDYYQAVATQIPRDLPSAIEGHVRWFDEMLENSLRNFWTNLPDSWRAASIHRLKGRWAKQPLVIVSAGPSLDDALPVLSRLSRNALILATGTTARILEAHQIRPDLLVSVDPYQFNRAHFSGLAASDVPLVYYHRISRGIVSEYAGPKFWFVMHDEPSLPLRPSHDPSPFARGGTVAYSALQLAHYLEADPIVFVGQDLAFPGGRTHAAGAPYGQTVDDTALPDGYFRVPGVDGQPVVTNRTYHGYLTLIEEYLRTVATTRPDVRHVNTSSRGARIAGTEFGDLEPLLRTLPPLPKAPREQIVRTLKRSGSPSRTEERHAMTRWVAELESLSETGTTDFEELFARFRTTDAYSQASKSYDSVYWVYESRYRNGSSQSRSIFLHRFRDHLKFVVDDLRAAIARES
jgi:hypothetical protein